MIMTLAMSLRFDLGINCFFLVPATVWPLAVRGWSFK